MDIFKILARSTNLQKSVQTNAPEPKIPSAAGATHSFASNVKAGTKRKRKGFQPVKNEPHEDVPTTLSTEECKKIFRSHKLKVSRAENSSFVPIYPQPLLRFSDLRSVYCISKRLAENIDSQGYAEPTEIQLASIPLQLANEARQLDVLSVAPTGSGKTLAFLVPILQRLTQKKSASRCVKAIVVAPTHELVDQITNEGRKLCAGTGVSVAPMQKNAALFQEGDAEQGTTIKADLLVGTPLALVHSISSRETPLESVLYLVLDEADVLLDPLFRDQTVAIWEACTSKSLQTSLWSATMSSSIESLAQELIDKRRSELGISGQVVRVVAGVKDSALSTIEHKLVYAASEQGKLLALRQLLHPTTSETTGLRPPFLVFTQTIERAIALHSELLYDIPPEAGGSSRIAVLHSDLSEPARSEIMAGFRRGEIWIIISTDVLARGIDFRGINGVVNYDIPNSAAAYVHRAGRTGRAGRSGGVAVTLYAEEDIPYMKSIANVIAQCEKAKGSDGVPKWLLDALPSLSKNKKHELKKRGVESRRSVKRSRISTKSGFERRLENKKRDRQKALSDSEWEGLED